MLPDLCSKLTAVPYGREDRDHGSRLTVSRLIQSGELAASVVSLKARRKVYRITPWALRMYKERHQVRWR
jgi:hypothetical protein